jgi:hypothetical protein
VKTALQNEGNDDWYVDTDPDRMPDTLLNVAEPNAVP